jgi:hypothetical protein
MSLPVTADTNFFLPKYVNDTQQGENGYLDFPLGPSFANGGRSQHVRPTTACVDRKYLNMIICIRFSLKNSLMLH